MSYHLLVYDPQKFMQQWYDELDELIDECNAKLHIKRDVELFAEDDPAALLNVYIARKREGKRIIFVYDGGLWLDSCANNALQTYVYNRDNVEIGHATSRLIDVRLSGFYSESESTTGKLWAEIHWNFWNRLAGDFLYPDEKITLDEKAKLISRLKNWRNS